MSVFLVPVGHDFGPRLVEEGPESGRYEFLVRVGSRVRHLDSLSFAIWLLAHDSENGLPERTAVVDATVRLGLDVEQASTAMDELLADGLLAEIEPGSERGFAERHQLLPLMVGLGPDGNDPSLRTVGLLDIPVVQVSEPLFQLWLWAHLRPSLWQACVEAAGTHDGPDAVPPGRVLSEVVAALHPLLASRAAYLDVREAA
ncbi:hypothetical protein [Flindersiella endophytica]